MSFIGLKSYGYGEVKAKLRTSAQKVPDHAARSMRTSAKKIALLAKLQCPHETGALEDSIHLEEMINEGNRRLMIDVVAGGMSDGVDTDKYAVLIHENYESIGKPGPGTLAKMAANPGVVIGSKFVERAVDNSEERLIKAMIQVVTEVIVE